MELTRRDAVVALAALGAGGVGAASRKQYATGDESDGGDSGESVRETLVATAEVLYPSEVSGIEAFVETFIGGRLDGGPHAEGVREAVEELEAHADAWYDDSFRALSTADRDSILREMRADTADEHPDGTTAEQVRYYIVNELLLALYASPTGGELVGIENPQGHAGGIDTYQRGPQA